MKENQLPTCLIVDDNKVARLMLRQLLEKINTINIIGECEDAIAARKSLEDQEIDILFLDIEMPGMSGLELLKVLPNKPLTILTTAKQGYAVEAFEMNVVDYLVKPFAVSRLMLAVERAIELLKGKESQLEQVSPDNIFIKEGKIIRNLDLNEVLYMEAKGDYVRIHVPGKSYIIHSTLRLLEEKLPSGLFLRVHRSYIIALNKIDYIEDMVVNIHGMAIPVSDSYRDQLLKNLHLL
ncbi:MAG: response regulator transcription factor [Pedobacter sp.]|nr:MAG: response regulator transcription factor [Pedobacter sp.]